MFPETLCKDHIFNSHAILVQIQKRIILIKIFHSYLINNKNRFFYWACFRYCTAPVGLLTSGFLLNAISLNGWVRVRIKLKYFKWNCQKSTRICRWFIMVMDFNCNLMKPKISLYDNSRSSLWRLVLVKIRPYSIFDTLKRTVGQQVWSKVTIFKSSSVISFLCIQYISA